MPIASCIGCGCTDIRTTCHDPNTGGPCSWLVVDYKSGHGVCSCCEQHMARWHAGERSLLMSVAKIVKDGETEPYYIERNAMELFPYQLGATLGDKFSLEWVGMTVEQFEALPQFEHVRLAKRWKEAYDAAEEAGAKGLAEEAQKHTAEAVRLAGEIQELGFDVLDLLDLDEGPRLGL